MKRFTYILSLLLLVLATQATLTSCRGKAASKTIEVIEKAASKSGKAASMGAKKGGNALKYGDDVYRAVDKYNESSSSTTSSTLKAVTTTCSSCAGYGQVNFVDEYGNYAYTGTCPDCDGEGTITKYE